MELALLVYIVETLTYNSSILWTIALLIAIGLLVAFSFKYWVQKDNRPEGTYSIPFVFREGNRFSLSEPHDTLEANVEYIFLYTDTSGDFRVSGLRPSSGTTYFRLRDIRAKLAPVMVEKPAINKQVNVRWKLATAVACVLTLLHVILPSKSTAYYMAGAYMVQKVMVSEDAKEIGSLAIDATKAQLRVWATKSPELANLMVQSGLNEIKQAANQADMDKL